MNTRNSKEYPVWNAMKARCYLKSHVAYNSYGGRCITVCERWRNSFDNFLLDVGSRPSSLHTLDRIDNNGNYEHGNVRWATMDVQGSNKRNNVWIELDGLKMTSTQWAKHLGMDRSAISDRIRQGYSPEEAIRKPYIKRKKFNRSDVVKLIQSGMESKKYLNH